MCVCVCERERESACAQVSSGRGYRERTVRVPAVHHVLLEA